MKISRSPHFIRITTIFGAITLILCLWLTVFVYWTSVHDELLWLQSSMHYGRSTPSFHNENHKGALGAVEHVVDALISGAVTPQIGAVLENAEQYDTESKTQPPGNHDAGKLSHENNEAINPSKHLINKSSAIEPEVHVIFSTDCSDYQNWQSVTLFYSALMCGQQGKITRIASGCSDIEIADLDKTYQKLYPEHYRIGDAGGQGQDGLTFRVHYTPDFKHDEKTHQKYAFYNKPRGLKHWLANAVPSIPANEVVALLDPDMIFLRPLTANVRSDPTKMYNKKLFFDKSGNSIKEMQDFVVTGRPVAQLYGLGGPWADDHHKKFNRTRICGPGSACLQVSQFDAEQYYSVGPPYLATRTDFDRIAKTWVDFVPKVYEQYPYLLAEMYAYSMAAAHEKLPHLSMYHYMVSNSEGGGEGWEYVDDLEDVCEQPSSLVEVPGQPTHMGNVRVERFYEGKPLPVLFHYCQHFSITPELSFYKGAHRDASSMSCETKPYPMCLPDTVGKHIDFKQHVRGTDIYKSTRKKKRGGFAVNIIHTILNRAISFYQKRVCS